MGILEIRKEYMQSSNNHIFGDIFSKGKKERQKEIYMMKKYGISKAEYDHMLEEQDYKCAICGKEEALVVDYDHETQKVRGLLCTRCNVTVGGYENALKIIKAIERYLKKKQ
jgi:DNA-directed RNA polymerase subunit RPC12/RpoP